MLINKRLLGGVAAIAAGALAFMPAAVRAGDGPAAPPVTKSVVPGWNEFIGHLADLPDRMLAKLPPSMQADPQVRQEVARLALESLTSQGLDAIGGDDEPGKPRVAGGASENAIRALVSLGYTTADAERGVRAALDAGGGGLSAAELIRAALAKLGGR